MRARYGLMTIADAHPLWCHGCPQSLARTFGAEGLTAIETGQALDDRGGSLSTSGSLSAAPQAFALGAEPGIADTASTARSSARAFPQARLPAVRPWRGLPNAALRLPASQHLIPSSRRDIRSR